MSDVVIKAFFYGSFMLSDIIKEHGFTPQKTETAMLKGYDLVISPYANLVRSPGGIVLGMLATGKQDEILSLYSGTGGTFGFRYLPEAVLVETLDNYFSPALCYICPDLPPAEPSSEYLDRMITAAKNSGFPGWYIDKINSFRSEKQ